MVDTRLGNGRVVLLGPRAQHRGQSHGTFKPLFNCILWYVAMTCHGKRLVRRRRLMTRGVDCRADLTRRSSRPLRSLGEKSAMKMSIPTAWLLVVVSVLIVAVGPADARQRHKWWESGDIKAELDITDEQSDAIEDVYQTTRPHLRTLMDTLSAEEEALSLLIDADHAPEADVAVQIDKVEAARGALSKERLLMIYRMHRELSVDQRAGLREWMEQNQRRPRR